MSSSSLECPKSMQVPLPGFLQNHKQPSIPNQFSKDVPHTFNCSCQGVSGPEEWLVKGIEAAQLTSFSSGFSPGSSTNNWFDVHFSYLSGNCKKNWGKKVA